MSHDDGDVVLSAGGEREVNQHFTLVLRTASRGEDVGDLRLRNHVCQSVCAEQHRVAVLQRELLDFDHRTIAPGADRVSQNVLQVFPTPFDGDWPADSGEMPIDRVVFGEP